MNGPYSAEGPAGTSISRSVKTNFEVARERRRPRATRVTHQQLVSQGFATGEAANPTGYLNRLEINDRPWTLTQVNTVH